METRKRWQLGLIIAVCLITLYNILPTLIYYLQPLKDSIDEERAQRIIKENICRIHALEEESIQWVHSFCACIGVKPTAIEQRPTEPSIITAIFPDAKQATLFKKFLPRAGALIPFQPAQLMLIEETPQDNVVLIARRIPVHFDVQDSALFSYVKKRSGNVINPLYFECIADRAVAVVLACKAPSATDPRADVLMQALQQQYANNPSTDAIYTLELGEMSSVIKTVTIDWAKDALVITPHKHIEQVLTQAPTTEEEQRRQDETRRLLMNTLATVTQQTNEIISQEFPLLQINLDRLPSSQSMIVMQLEHIGEKVARTVEEQIRKGWFPTHRDLISTQFPLFNEEAYTAAPFDQKRLCMVVLGPKNGFADLKHKAVYVVLRGVQSIADQYRQFPDSEDAKRFNEDIEELALILQKQGFVGYSGATLGKSSPFAKDIIFELSDYYSSLLKATREQFYVIGTKSRAILELGDVEQRIITENRIDNAIQEDLIRWKEAYQAAQVDLDPNARYSVPAPTKNVYWENFKRSIRAYFRGDDSRVLRWGLDLSGGKSVRIALVDDSGRPVKNERDLKQAVSELYNRINNMGVSERTIRIENDTIVIDFPGSQAFNAAELVRASSMYFHVVNEQFGLLNQALAKEVNEFLQEVWNEAVVTHRKNSDEINQIAFEKLQAAGSRASTLDIKDSAQLLWEKGLRLANLKSSAKSASFDDSLSIVARMAGDTPADWHGQTHPLMIVFHNYALDGASLDNVQTGYDPSKGNILLFEVKSRGSGQNSNPQEAFALWTGQFCEEKIVGTALETISRGHGWRMAVILNGRVISSPALHSSLRDKAIISGNFSQREVARLAADLQAGSLTFTPKILSEENVSSELGNKEKKEGIIATTAAIISVILLMVGYYRFGGVVASVAVLFNLLVMWAVMQNIGYALTLPVIAGLVLTVGMAVDANVLVFERIREELRVSKKLSVAISAGYQKAFSAIIDSNITSILAALILIQFDCGPIRGFAIALIIGIIASLFTSLFMTRYFFAGWVRNPAHTTLKMVEVIKNPRIDFLKWGKSAIIISLLCLIFGGGVLATQWRSIFGMDFTGGYALIVDVVETGGALRDQAVAALMKEGLTAQDVQVRELSRSNLLRIHLARGLEEPGRPFYNLPQTVETKTAYAFQKNPRITWLVDVLQKGGLQVKPTELDRLDHNWTSMSGQFSENMRTNAFIALALAMLMVLIYIAFRFEWTYAVSAVIGLLHDVFLTLSVVALAHKLHIPVQIDLQVIGAIMTIIGYSLNDTIIVFDRIREDMQRARRKPFSEIVTIALNATLSRTLMTSGTTAVVLLCLVCFGGSSLFAFSFVMLVGVLLGTLSSLFVAAPILVWLERKEDRVFLVHS